MSQCKGWVFTWNNYPDASLTFIKRLFREGKIKGYVVGKEIAQSGTPHLQGFVSFKKRLRLSGVRAIFAEGNPAWRDAIHWEPCRDRAASVEYCKKDGDYIEDGIIGNERGGKRDGFESGLREYMEHRNLKRFKQDHPGIYVRYSRGISTLLDAPVRDIENPPKVVYIYGPTGTGKTSMVFRKFKDIWISGRDLQWFDGYDGQECALFDDFRGSMCKFSYLLRILDRYPLQVPIKGGFVNWAPKYIVLTSNTHPREVYDVPGEDKNQLMRRITRIIHLQLQVNDDTLLDDL